MVCVFRKVFDKLEKLSDGELGKALQTTCQAFDSKDMPADSSGPRLSVRALARYSSDPEGQENERLDRAKKERAEIWSKAKAVRKQHWQIEVWTSTSKAQDLKAQMLTARAAFKATVELNEKHRACFLSADLVGEGQPGWSNSAFEKKHSQRLELLASALAEMDSESSFAFVFDGRIRENRKVIEDVFAKVSVTETAELWLSYEKVPAEVIRKSFPV